MVRAVKHTAVEQTMKDYEKTKGKERVVCPLTLRG